MRILAFLVWLAFVSPTFAESPVWQPTKTWVFAVGVLRFQGKEKNDWPEASRQDAVMLETLRQRGVPADHIVFLKNEQAKLASLREQFPAFLRRLGSGDLLIFYYAGHGGRDYSSVQRPVHFVPYDSAGWETSEVLTAIEKTFKGTQVLLTADCCHSGGLAEEAARHQGRIGYGVLTSTRSSATSTGAWTFTQCLTDLYAGKPALDLNHDGVITFAEAGQYCDLKMAFHENQRSTNAVTGTFPHDFVFAKPGPATPQPLAEKAEGLYKDKWYPTEILKAADGKYFVTWPGYNSSWDGWLAPEDIRPAGHELFAKGAAIEIQWGNDWYKGEIIGSALGLLLVHYEGYPATDNEWVPMKRLRPRK